MIANMKGFFGKRRATRSALGGLKNRPFGRLGALVFQLNNSDKLYWASLRAPTRIAGCALSPRPNGHPLGRRSLRKATCKFTACSRQNNGGFAERDTSSFSLSAVVAEGSKKTPGGGLRHHQDRMHPQSTDELSAQVALLQSPILPAVRPVYQFKRPPTSHHQ